MPMHHVFQNCNCQIERVEAPDGQKMVVMVIIDPQTAEVWRYPTSEENAKILGQELMGIGSFAVANGHDAAVEVRRRGGKQ